MEDFRLTRLQVVIVACVSAIIVFVTCLAASVYLSWRLAIADALGELTLLNHGVIARANFTYADAVDTLQSMGKSELQPCSDAHIAQMRQATANNRRIAGVGYFRDNILLCSGWGLSKTVVKKAQVDFVTEDGVSISVDVHPEISRSSPRLGLYLGGYGVLIDPEVLLDSLTDPDNQFAVAINGTVVARRNNPDQHMLETLIARPASGIDRQNLYSAVNEAGLTAVAIKPRRDIAASFGRQNVFFVPIGMSAAFLLIACIIQVTRRRLSPLGELKVAVRQRRFTVLYQPIVEIRTGICVGAEALVRWRARNGDIILPVKFMNLAEASGLILPITDQVIDCILRDLGSTLRDEQFLHISINTCAADISTGRLIDVLEDKLKDTGIRKEQIWLEATERGFIDVGRARDAIVRARELGYLISIDDFGTGFSCLQYLESLAIDALKIDKSFVDTIGRVTSKSPMLPHIVEIARSLNIGCIAEGVETEEQLDYLRGQGVALAQGWLISKPLSAGEFLAFRQRRIPGSAARDREPLPAQKPFWTIERA